MISWWGKYRRCSYLIQLGFKKIQLWAELLFFPLEILEDITYTICSRCNTIPSALIFLGRFALNLIRWGLLVKVCLLFISPPHCRMHRYSLWTLIFSIWWSLHHRELWVILNHGQRRPFNRSPHILLALCWCALLTMILLHISLIVRYWCMRCDQGVYIYDGFLRRRHLKPVSRFLFTRILHRNRLVLHLVNIMRRALNKVVLLIYLFWNWRPSLSRLIAWYLIHNLTWQVVASREILLAVLIIIITRFIVWFFLLVNYRL